MPLWKPVLSRPSYYKQLGVAPSATAAEIRRAFRHRAAQVHPDRHGGDPRAEEEFKQLARAYEVLSDPSFRTRYDASGMNAFDPPPPVASRGNDVQQRMGGGRSATSAVPERGANLSARLKVTLLDLIKGAAVQFLVPRYESCHACGGHGITGGGAESKHKQMCTDCKGTGRRRTKRRLEIKIPAGVEDGELIRIAGEGDCGLRGGEPGDLFVALQMEPHPFYRRNGADLLCQVAVPFYNAALGCVLEIPPLGKPHHIQIPGGTQSHQQLRLAGQGLPRKNGKGRGDLLIQVLVEIPTKLDPTMKRMLQQMSRVASDRPDQRQASRSKSKGLSKRVGHKV